MTAARFRQWRPLTVTALCLAHGTALASAWPTVRGDYRRSGISPDVLAAPLHRQWVHTPSLPPAPAWPPPAEKNISAGSDTLSQSHIYDRAFHVVGDSNRLYYGSSADDSVHCLDASSGRVLWSFATEGPVRLAPTLHDNKLYAGSDDGHLYCLKATEGKLLWRTRATPDDRRFPGNGRIISRWPVRAGVVVDSGVAYFTAGIFPSEGVYVCAVSAESGKPVWRQPLTSSPQGYMAASSSQLFIPSGRTPFHQVERSTGRSVGKYGNSKSWGRDLVGGSFAVLVDGRLATGPSEDGHIHLFDANSRVRVVRARGRQLIVTDGTAFVLMDDGVEALDRASYMEQKKFVHRWKRKLGRTHAMALARNALVVGGEGRVATLDVRDGDTLWEARLKGRVEGLAVMDGRLLASSDNGSIVCFGPTPAPDGTAQTGSGSASEAAHPGLSASVRVLVGKSIEAVPNPRGYALVLGLETPGLVEQLASSSGLRIVGIDASTDRARAARDRLRQAGVYGSGAAIHQAPLDKLPYVDQSAALVVISPGRPDARALRESAWRLVRPCGGVLAWMERTPEGGSDVRLRTRGAETGSGDWSHFYADAGNTACSYDAFPPGETEIQWFGQPGPRRMIARHWKTVAPLYKNGRMFVSGNDYIAALDAYSGAVLWERDVARSVRIAAFKDTGNMVATDKHLYVAAEDRCRVFDAATGVQLHPLHLPRELRSTDCEWGYVAHVERLLFGSVAKRGASFRRQLKELTPTIWGNHQPLITSTALFALDTTDSHKTSWTYEPETGVVINPTIAVADGRVLFVESGNGNAATDSDGRLPLAELLNPSASLVALDATTGRPLWREEVNLKCMHHILFLSVAERKVLLSGTRYVRNGARKRIRYELKTYSAESGKLVWENTQVPDYDHVLDGDHGEQVQHPAIANGVVYGPGFACRLSTGEPHDGWAWHKSHKCTTLSLSRRCAFSRFSKAKNPFMFDLDDGKQHRLTTITRPGCWINIVPAGGLILIPEASAGCTCEYPIQTSLALRPAK